MSAVCECDVCLSFGSPRRKPQMGAFGPPVAWRGRWYHRAKSGHYKHARGPLLHRRIWEAHRGSIPEGMFIHHIDHDPGNNTLDNLLLVTPKEHAAEHPERGRVLADMSTAARREVSTRYWRERQPQPKTCAECGAAFESTGMRAMYCGKRCWKKVEYRRWREQRQPA